MEKLKLDVLGQATGLAQYTSEQQIGRGERVALWAGAVLGLSNTAFPQPEGWMLDLGDITVDIRLDELQVKTFYDYLLLRESSVPSCQDNWKKYVREELPWKEIWGSFLRPGIYTPHHFMTFFKVLHRALPTNTRFQGSGRCRLGCRCQEHFVHFLSCNRIRGYWKQITDIMSSLGSGVYRPTKLLIFFTLRREGGELKVINRHMKGLIWLAWKFLWQQLAAIGLEQADSFDPAEALQGVFRMHHAAVLAALHDYRMVQQAKGAGGCKYCKREQEEAERFRVGPFVTIGEHGTTLTYKPNYQALRGTKLLCPLTY